MKFLKSIMQAFARPLRDDRGAVMTEFVILLPVFVMLFVGIVELNKLQRLANKVHIKANQMLWVGAVEVEESAPNTKWGDPKNVDEIAPPPPENCDAERYHECAGFDWNKYKRLNDYGTFGEAISASDFENVREYLDREENLANWRDEQEMDLRLYNEVYDADAVWGAYALSATWDRHHSDSSFLIPPSFPAGAFPEFEGANLNGAPLVGGKKSAMAYGAGTRYGLVVSSAAEAEANSQIEFQTLAPPRAMDADDEEVFTVGTSRLLMRGTGFDRIPGFEYELELAGFNIEDLEE